MELASLELPDHAPELVDEGHGCGLQDVPSKPWTRVTVGDARCWQGFERSHTQGIVTGELVFVWRKVKKNGTDARTALVAHRWYGPPIVVAKEKDNVFVSCRGRVTKVAPECLRKASVAEQMSWDITTKEKALFETALGKENLSWEGPLFDESGEFHESETPDTMARLLILSEEVNSPMNDDGEPPVAEKDDHSEDKTQVEEPDLATEESRGVVREPLRLPQRRLRSKQSPPSVELEEGVESKFKKARVTVTELLHDAFLVKAARSKEKQWHGLNGREKLLFLEAVSKQWNAWQENAAVSVIPRAEA